MNLIVAVDKNWGIGKDNNLLVHLKGDMKFFREKTLGKVVVMGRKTLESFPNSKPLKNRVNIVLSRDRNYSVEGAQVVADVDERLEAADREPEEDLVPDRRVIIPQIPHLGIEAVELVIGHDQMPIGPELDALSPFPDDSGCVFGQGKTLEELLQTDEPGKSLIRVRRLGRASPPNVVMVIGMRSEANPRAAVENRHRKPQILADGDASVRMVEIVLHHEGPANQLVPLDAGMRIVQNAEDIRVQVIPRAFMAHLGRTAVLVVLPVVAPDEIGIRGFCDEEEVC